MKGHITPGANIDLGLAVSALNLEPGERRTTRDLAAFCNCTQQAIFHIEQRALRKLRVRFRFHKDPVLREAVEHLITR